MQRSDKQTITQTLGRSPIHPFPARMAPGIALAALGTGKKRLKVLDPMSGSGTVVAVAKAKGHSAIGIDIDPLSVLLATVWTTPVREVKCIKRAREVLARAMRRFENLAASAAYPKEADAETKAFLRYWFDTEARKQLFSLATCIGRVRNKTERNVLWAGFSRLIIAKSFGASLAMDLSHSRPHKKFKSAPAKPFAHFLGAVSTVTKNCPVDNGTGVGPRASVTQGDARDLRIASSSIDLVLTSPPYLNAIDYMRCSKFSLIWMGYTASALREVRSVSVGTEAARPGVLEDAWANRAINRLRLSGKLSSRNRGLLATYALDMRAALGETQRVLKRNGRAVYVVGDSVSKGIFISNSRIVAAAAKDKGLKLVSKRSRALPANRRYLPPPEFGGPTTMDGRMRREVVLVFTKQ